MKRSIILALAILASPTFAAESVKKVPRASTSIKKFHALKLVDATEAQKLIEAGGIAVDANNAETRASEGTIPGAIQLPSANNYDLALLPTDKTQTLVFYCANERCMASHDAAKAAIKAGYSNVKVLSTGIKGWNELKNKKG